VAVRGDQIVYVGNNQSERAFIGDSVLENQKAALE